MAIHTGVKGLKIEVETNLNNIDYGKFIITKPDNTTFEVNCEIDNNIISYTTKKEDFDIPGTYTFQPYVEAGEFAGKNDKIYIDVKE
jgi:hypothetical protein